MKKQLLFLGASVFSLFTANAQITITSGDMPTSGKTAIEAVDTVFAGITPGTSGASQTWDFSTLANHKSDTTTFVAPGSLSGSGNFPAATLAAVATGTQDEYLEITTGSLNILGLYGDFGAPIGVTALKFNPYKKEISLPSTYNTTDTGAYTFVFQFPYTAAGPTYDSVRMSTSASDTILIDGHGSLTTPAFTGVSSLRQKSTEVQTSNTYIHQTGGSWVLLSQTVDTVYNYSWWANTQNYPLVQIKTNKVGATTGARYLVSMQNTVTGIAGTNAEKNSIAVYPSPAKDIIHITGVSGTIGFLVSDVTGRIVENSLLKDFTNSYSVSNLENGVYLYQAIDLKGKVVGNGKFVVAK